jgi:hypothetical protein
LGWFTANIRRVMRRDARTAQARRADFTANWYKIELENLDKQDLEDPAADTIIILK